MLRRAVVRIEALPRAALPLVVGVVALAARLWVFADMRSGNPLAHVAILDDRIYLDMAEAVRDGSAAGRAWFLAPLYPYVLAAAFGVAQGGLATAALLGVLAGTATSVVVALTARALHSQTAGFVAGLLTALAGTLLFHDTLPGQEPLLGLLHVLSLAATCVWLRRGAPLAAGAAGLAAGVAALGRATSLALALAALAAAALHLRPRATFLRGAAALALGLALALVPAAVRNARVTGTPTPFPWSGGVNLYVANGPDARAEVAFGSRLLGTAPDRMEAAAREIAERDEGRTLTPSEISSYWTRRTWRDGGGAAALLGHGLRKALLFFAAGEYGNTHWVGVEGRFATLLRILPTSGWWLIALGAAGWWFARRGTPALDVVALTVAATWAALTVYYPVSRYRLPVLPLLAVAAGVGVAAALVPDADRRRLRQALGVALAVALLAHAAPLVRPTPGAAPSYVNVATALVLEERADEAEALLDEGLRDWPDDGRLHLEKGRLLAARRAYAEALPHLRAAESDASLQWIAGVPGLLCLVRTGQLDAAEQVGQLLLEKLPPDPALQGEMLAYWALAAAARGDPREAARRMSGALQLAPGNPAVEAARRELHGL